MEIFGVHFFHFSHLFCISIKVLRSFQHFLLFCLIYFNQIAPKKWLEYDFLHQKNDNHCEKSWLSVKTVKIHEWINKVRSQSYWGWASEWVRIDMLKQFIWRFEKLCCFSCKFQRSFRFMSAYVDFIHMHKR